MCPYCVISREQLPLMSCEPPKYSECLSHGPKSKNPRPSVKETPWYGEQQSQLAQLRQFLVKHSK